MPRQNKVRNGRRKKSKPAAQSSESQKLQQLIDIQTTQLRGAINTVRDVPPMIRPKPKAIMIWRKFSASTVTSSASVDVSSALSFNLSQLPDYQEFTQLFDSYRILQADVEFVPTSNVSVHSPLFTAIDYDDANSVGLLNSFLEYDTCTENQPGATVIRRIQPRVAMAAYTNTFTGYAVGPKNMWINSSSPGVQHYGLKYYLPSLASSTTSGPVYTIWVTLWCQFKGIQ